MSRASSPGGGRRLRHPRRPSDHDHIELPRRRSGRSTIEMVSGATRRVALVLCVSLVASACGSSGADEAADQQLGGAADEDGVLVGTGVFGGRFSDDTVDEANGRLAESGIAVFPDEGGPAIVAPVEPVSPLRLLRWQVRNMTLEATSGAGLSGSDLNDLVVPDPDHPEAPSPAQFLAAYVHGVETPGAELSRDLIGDQDLAEPDTVVFPTMVMTMFASDLARAADELAGPETGTEPEVPTETTEVGAGAGVDLGPVQLASSSQAICPDFAGFINQAISDLVRVLKLPRITVPNTGIPILNAILQAGADLFVGFLNFAIDAAAELLIAGKNVLLKPVFSVLTSIAAVFAVTTQIVNALRPWTVQTTAAEDPVHRGVEAPATDEITVRVSVPGPPEWPDFIQSCARAVGLDLPPLRPHGGHVTWNTVDPRGVASVSSKEETLDDTAAARLVLDVGQETSEQHAKGQDDRALVKLTASLRRQEVEDFKGLVRGLIDNLFDGVPAIISQHLTYYSSAAVDVVLDDLADHIVDAKSFVYLTVTFHGPPEPDDKSGPTNAGTVADACDLLPDDQVADVLGWEVEMTTYNPDPSGLGDLGDGEVCGKFDRELDESDWDVGETGNPDRPIYVDVEFRMVQVLLSPPMDDGMIDQFSTMMSDSEGELAADGGSLDPTDGIGDEGYLFRYGDQVFGMTLRVGDRVVTIVISNGAFSNAQGASASDYLEIARIVADRMG